MTQADPDAAARDTLRWLGADPPDWVPERAGIDHNVAIIGGGQTGCAIAFALRRAGIGRVTIIDAAADETQAGIWLTAARMNLLRTPKTLPGPEQGIPALSFQAWYEARHGAAAYAAIDRIPRTGLGRVSALVSPLPADPHPLSHAVAADRAGRSGTFACISRRTGSPGRNGAQDRARHRVHRLWRSLSCRRCCASRFLPRLYAHTEDAIDFAALRGKVVAVIGAAASAFDAAGRGAGERCRGRASVRSPAGDRRGADHTQPRLCGRLRQLCTRCPMPHAGSRRCGSAGAGSTPTTDAIERTVAFANFHLHLAAPWESARVAEGRILARVGGGEFRCDFVIAGTGYQAELEARPELAGFADQVLLWRDRFVPPSDADDDWLGAHPYLGAGHEFLEKRRGSAPYLRDIHVQNPAGFVSFGVPTGDVPSMKRDIPAIVAQISRDLFFADLGAHEQRMTRDVAPDFTAAAYATAISQAGKGIPP